MYLENSLILHLFRKIIVIGLFLRPLSSPVMAHHQIYIASVLGFLPATPLRLKEGLTTGILGIDLLMSAIDIHSGLH